MKKIFLIVLILLYVLLFFLSVHIHNQSDSVKELNTFIDRVIDKKNPSIQHDNDLVGHIEGNLSLKRSFYDVRGGRRGRHSIKGLQSKLIPYSTNQQEVISLLGHPAESSFNKENKEVWTYVFRRSTLFHILDHQKILFLAFSSRGVLVNVEFKEDDSNRKTLVIFVSAFFIFYLIRDYIQKKKGASKSGKVV